MFTHRNVERSREDEDVVDLEVDGDAVGRRQGVAEEPEGEEDDGARDGAEEDVGSVEADGLLEDHPGGAPLHGAADGEHVDVAARRESVAQSAATEVFSEGLSEEREDEVQGAADPQGPPERELVSIGLHVLPGAAPEADHARTHYQAG